MEGDDLKIDILEYVQPYRPEWNKFGPPLPRWFVNRVKKLDPQIVFQFAPPSDYVRIELKQSGGADPKQYPEGVWIIGRRLRNTGMVFRRAVLNVVRRGSVLFWIDTTGALHEVTPELVERIRFARDEVRRGAESSKLEEEADLAYQEMINARDAEWRNKARQRAAKTLSRIGTRKPGRMFVPAMN